MQYQWLRNNEKIPGATRGRYVAKTPGFYKVVVYTDKSCKNVSNVIKVTKSCGPVESKDASSERAYLNGQSSSVIIFPNPSKGNISVTYNSSISGAIQLNVFDVSGKKLFAKIVQAVAGNNVWQLDLGMLAAGVYTLGLNVGGEGKNVRFVIEK